MRRHEQPSKSKWADLDRDHCVRGHVGDSLEVLLPRPPDGNVLVLEATVGQRLPRCYAWRDGEKDDNEEDEESCQWFDPSSVQDELDLHFVARLHARERGDETIVMGAKVLTFFWPREQCFYPDKCPEARVHGSTGTCKHASETNKEGERLGCWYRCELAEPLVSNEPFDVPVTFRGHIGINPQPEWRATLKHLNDYVDKEMDAEDLYVRVDFGSWHRRWRWRDRDRPGEPADATQFDVTIGHRKETDSDEQAEPEPERQIRHSHHWAASDDRIDRVWLRAPGGTRHSIELALHPNIREDQQHFMKIRELSCDEGVEIEPEGQRGYKPHTVIVKDGTIELPHPMDQARRLHWGFGVDVVGHFPVRPSDLVADVRVRPGVIVGMTPRIKFRSLGARSWRFDLGRTELMLSEQPYQALSEEPGAFDPKLQNRDFYMRGMLGAVVRSPEWSRPAIGSSAALGLMLGTGRPMFRADERFVGSWDMNLTVLLEFPVRVGKRFELRPSARFICLENLHRSATDLQGASTPTIREQQLCTFAAGLGASVTLEEPRLGAHWRKSRTSSR